VVYEWSRLGERPFENLCRALAVHVLGPGVQAFGDGPDGGREASFDGPVTYGTAPGGAWNGYGVVQAKFRRTGAGTRDTDWLRRQLAGELDKWCDPASKRVSNGRIPEYLIVVTNVRLSSAARVGGIDRIRTVLTGYAERLGLKGCALWDANQLSMYLDAYPQVSARFAEFLTPGDVLAKTFVALDGLGAAPVRESRFRVGQGHPGNERAFKSAYVAGGGPTMLGEATSEAYEDGPGWVQHFDGGPDGTVICARHEAQPVAVDMAVWDAIRSAGPGQLSSVGYPTVTSTTAPLIAADVDDVLLDGGTWGPGRLVRGREGGWRWEPQVAFSRNTRERDRWDRSGARMDLRLRCAARLSWLPVDLTIDGAGRNRVLTALREGPLPAALTAFADQLGLDPVGTQWERTPPSEGYNDERFLSYRRLIPGPTGRTALGLWTRFQLSDGIQPFVVSLVDIRADFAAISNDDPKNREFQVDPTHRLGTSHLQHFFAAAWTAAISALPLAATRNPLTISPAGPSTTELHLNSERAPGYGGERVLGLLDMLDLHIWGEPPSEPPSWMSIAVTAPPTLDSTQIADLVAQAMHRMASGFGFLEPDLPSM
jgi:hypothetical protein